VTTACHPAQRPVEGIRPHPAIHVGCGATRERLRAIACHRHVTRLSSAHRRPHAMRAPLLQGIRTMSHTTIAGAAS